MSTRYKTLLSPIQVGNVLLKNRMMATAGIPHMLQGTEPYPTEKIITHISNRAKNGASAVYVNFDRGSPEEKGDVIDLSFPGHDAHMDMTKKATHNYMCQLIDAIRYYGSFAITMPSGDYTREFGPGGPEHSSPGHGVDFTKDDPEMWLKQEQEACRGRSVDHITRSQIQEYIDSTVENAKILKAIGFEMQSIHNAYHNGLIAEFWSTHTNHRKDEYGGCVRNRARLFIEVYDALKQTLGRDYPLESLISVVGLGVSVEDTIELSKLTEGLIDIFHIRHGDKDLQHPIGYTSTREHPCPNIEAAAALKGSILLRGGKQLVAVSAGLQNPDYNEKILLDRKADIICMSRAWICDSEYIKKIKEDRGEDITPCIRCNKCHVPNESDKFRSFCSVNPIIGFETKLQRMTEPVTAKKKVAVVGGGPAGMQAVITCAKRGHEVTLYEKESVLGGQLFHAKYSSFKWPLDDFKNWLIRQTYKTGIKVFLNTEATSEMLVTEGFDDVIVAIGPQFERPNIPGADGRNTMLAIDVYGREKELPQNIVVVGGSETGTETGMYLAENGHTVTVLTRQGMLSADAPHAHFAVMQMDAYKALNGFNYVRWISKYLSIDENGVTYLDKDGDECRIDCDLVVISGGVSPRPADAAKFYGAGKNMHYIGDCFRAGDVHMAISAGFATANQI